MSKQECVRWYAVQTRARSEKAIAQRLQEQGLRTFLPLVTEVRRWSDRKKKVELPLFSCYVFVKLAAGNNQERLRVYRTNGVFRIVSMHGEAIPIPDEQIDALRTVITEQVPWSEHPFLKIGQRVRIRGGSLDGVEGELISQNGDRVLIISVDAIQRSLSVRVEGYDVEPL
jgi:transcription antitermination factor NusG